jgi:hypothetical protein
MSETDSSVTTLGALTVAMACHDWVTSVCHFVMCGLSEGLGAGCACILAIAARLLVG